MFCIPLGIAAVCARLCPSRRQHSAPIGYPRTVRAVRGRGSAGNTTNNIPGALRCLTEWPGICDNKKNRRTVAASSGLPFVGLKTALPFLSLFMYAATIHLQNTTLLLFCQAVIFEAGGNCSETTSHPNGQRRFALVKPLTFWVRWWYNFTPPAQTTAPPAGPLKAGRQQAGRPIAGGATERSKGKPRGRNVGDYRGHSTHSMQGRPGNPSRAAGVAGHDPCMRGRLCNP